MKPMISFKSNWSIGNNRVESTGTVGDESQEDAQEVEEEEGKRRHTKNFIFKYLMLSLESKLNFISCSLFGFLMCFFCCFVIGLGNVVKVEMVILWI
ncbi:hypothetical protein M9H77_08716 [Catharanthus roseus]|uniref:Uncharacterized protein n=1 Tax=Catharanthus roseus TaxID=4058 RepID=A0ACC0BYR5_CATRO|nr:hypothetical protein M9H77_08716 [Catharanthus roseus]